MSMPYLRTSTAFGYSPVNVLRRIFNVASLAVNAVLRVDLQTFLSWLVLVIDIFVDTSYIAVLLIF